MRLSNISFIIEYTTKAYEEIGVAIKSERIEEIAVLINNAMTSDRRIYHDPHHIWLLLQESRGLEILGVLFHDSVYQEIDDTLSEHFTPIFKYVIHGENGFSIKPKDEVNSNELNLVMDIFGLQKSEDFKTFSGQNEFLSALFAVEVLKDELDMKSLSQIVTLIESTIPFRQLSPNGNTCYDELYERLLKVNESFSLNQSSEELADQIIKAQKIAFLDVASFYKFSLKDFLTETWKLIPESNITLLNKNTCTSRSIRKAMFNMYKFFHNVDPYLVFQQFQETPSGKEYDLIIRRCKSTLEASRRYLEVRLIEIGLLEILTDLSGGEIPHSLFVGDVPFDARRKVKRIELFITELKKRETNPDILKLLVDGLSANSRFEYRRSLLGAHVYESIGDENIAVVYEIFDEYFQGNIKGKQVLENISQKLIKSFVLAMAEMAPIRSEKLKALL